jgi:hypothetical protein
MLGAQSLRHVTCRDLISCASVLIKWRKHKQAISCVVLVLDKRINTAINSVDTSHAERLKNSDTYT